MDVTAARDMHQSIISQLMTGPGSSERAMHEAERKFNLSYWKQWTLRHKRRASPGFIEQIKLAYLLSLESSVRRDLSKLEKEQAVLGAHDNADLEGLIAEAKDILAKIAERRALT